MRVRRLSREEELKEILNGNMEVLENKANYFGRMLASEGLERQVRKVFETVLKSRNLELVNPRIKYQAAKEKKNELMTFCGYVSNLVDHIRREENEERLKSYRTHLEMFLEAVVAYTRYHKEMGREY
ncbi:hypothetical protein DRP04_04755 [Archaeoglobales archaeon]|nr:MAG: hypothetical protein DRP04_04755 [Archaeoglobales archaeon]